jgi:hypothetical protein
MATLTLNASDSQIGFDNIGQRKSGGRGVELPGPPRVQSDGPPESLSGQSAGHQSPCGSVVCPTSMM